MRLMLNKVVESFNSDESYVFMHLNGGFQAARYYKNKNKEVLIAMVLEINRAFQVTICFS